MTKKRAAILMGILLVLYLSSMAARLAGLHDGARPSDPGCAGGLGCMIDDAPVAVDEVHSACFVAVRRRFEVAAAGRCTVQIRANPEVRLRRMELTVTDGELDLDLDPAGEGPGALELSLHPMGRDETLNIHEDGATLRLRCRSAAPCRMRMR